jgi:hypothetical protein
MNTAVIFARLTSAHLFPLGCLSLSFLIPHLAVRPLWFISSHSYLSARLKISEYFCFCLLDYDTRQATQLAGVYGREGGS